MQKETYITPSTLDAKCEEWLEQIADCNFRERQLHPDRAALIVVDMQRFFLDDGQPLACENSRVVIPRVKALIDCFRAGRRPVIYLQNMELAPRGSEKVIPQRRYGGFYGTDLDLTLRTMKVSDVVVCGVVTNVCPETTAREAFMHDYRVFFVADATATLTEKMHVASLRTLAGWFAKVVRVIDMAAALGGA